MVVIRFDLHERASLDSATKHGLAKAEDEDSDYSLAKGPGAVRVFVHSTSMGERSD